MSNIVDLFDVEARSFNVDSVRLSYERIQMKSYLKSKGVTLPLERPFIPTYKIISEYNRVKNQVYKPIVNKAWEID